MPADSSSGIPRKDGPSIWMTKGDHKKTGSHGNQGKPSEQYREAQRKRIEDGDYRGALAMDARDIRGKFGKKYNEALRQAIYYAKKLPEFKK